MNTDQIQVIEYTIDTIEKNLEDDIRLDTLSREVGISKYHLLRLFKSISGKTLMSYVRARRLALSLSDLHNTDLNIIDIAAKYHFQYEQSYIRAFQNNFHVTPAKYRRLKYELPIEQKIDINSLYHAGMGIVIRPRMVIKPAFYIQGIKDRLDHDKNLEEFSANKLTALFYEQYRDGIPNKVNEDIFLSMTLHTAEYGNSFDYIPCVETSVLNITKEPYVTFSIPTQEYAVFRYVGLHSPSAVNGKSLKEVYDYIKGYWIKNTVYRQTQPYHFERMDSKVCSDTYSEMDIYIPISR